MVIELELGDVDRVESLWREMVAHHAGLGVWPVREADDAWRLRRAQYAGWLSTGEGALLAAEDEHGLAGYACLRVSVPGATWDLGERIGELESLAVAARARGAGVGTALIAAARERLRAQGVGYWLVAVVEANADAVRLYEREGFRPFYRSLVAPT